MGTLNPDTPGRRQREQGRHLARLDRSPCNRPPARMAPPTLTFKAREALTHLTFDGKIAWLEQTVDTSGLAVSVVDYEAEVRGTDAAGNKAELEDGKSRLRLRRKAPPAVVPLKCAEITTGTTAEFEARREHNLEVGDKFKVRGVTPAGYNGEWTASAVPDDFTVRAVIGTSPADATEFGELVDAEDSLHVIIEHVPNPRSTYREARIRGRSSEGCWSRWSAWTAPVLPWTGSDPLPPAPSFVSLTFDRQGQQHHNPWRGALTFTPVRDWDVPGGDTEDDLARYPWKIEVSENDGGSWHKHAQGTVEDKQDGETTQNVAVVFRNIRRRNQYRAWLRSVDRYGRRSATWAGPFPSSGVGPGGTPNAVTNVQIAPKGPRRLKATWEDPPDFEDMDYWEIEWWRRNPLTLMEVNRSRNRNDIYRVPEADKTKAHFAKVFAVDVDDVHSPASQSADSSEVGDFDGLPPIGATVLWHGAIPAWGFRCNGATDKSTTAYPVLFGIFGYTFGGSGSSFGVPDFRKRTVRGVGDTNGANFAGAPTSLADTDGLGEGSRWEIVEGHPGGDGGESGAHIHGPGTLTAQATTGTVLDVGGSGSSAARFTHTHTNFGGDTGAQNSSHHHNQPAGTMNSASAGGDGHARGAYGRAHYVVRHD